MRANSLALRLFLWATGWTVVILIITGIALSTLYRHAVERAFDRRLDVYLRTLVADVASPVGSDLLIRQHGAQAGAPVDGLLADVGQPVAVDVVFLLGCRHVGPRPAIRDRALPVGQLADEFRDRPGPALRSGGFPSKTQTGSTPSPSREVVR